MLKLISYVNTKFCVLFNWKAALSSLFECGQQYPNIYLDVANYHIFINLLVNPLLTLGFVKNL